jgi:HK97 gp10 family phage protein
MNYVNIKGGAELQAFLNTLSPKVEKNLMRGALRSAAKIIADEAKLNAPVKSGELRKSIRVSTRAKKGQVSATIKAGNKKVFYAIWQEYGTAAHSITAKGNGYLTFNGAFSKSVNVRGVTPRAFMRPALDSRANDAINEVGLYIGKRLTKQGLNAPSISVESEE